MDYIQALQAAGKKAKREFGWLIFLGILNVILGFLAVVFTGISTLVSVIYLGWMLLFSGVATVYFAFKLRKIGGHWSLYIFGTLAIVCGVLYLINPAANAFALTLLVAIFLFTSGLVTLISVFFEKYRHKGWVVLNSLISILCAVIIYTEWPFSGTWVLGTFFGVYLLFHGVTQIQIGSAGKKMLK